MNQWTNIWNNIGHHHQHRLAVYIRIEDEVQGDGRRVSIMEELEDLSYQGQ